MITNSLQQFSKNVTTEIPGTIAIGTAGPALTMEERLARVECELEQIKRCKVSVGDTCRRALIMVLGALEDSMGLQRSIPKKDNR
jgi:hypothetical protein